MDGPPRPAGVNGTGLCRECRREIGRMRLGGPVVVHKNRFSVRCPGSLLKPLFMPVQTPTKEGEPSA